MGWCRDSDPQIENRAGAGARFVLPGFEAACVDIDVGTVRQSGLEASCS
jgi:hypothetical protein